MDSPLPSLHLPLHLCIAWPLRLRIHCLSWGYAWVPEGFFQVFTHVLPWKGHGLTCDDCCCLNPHCRPNSSNLMKSLDLIQQQRSWALNPKYLNSCPHASTLASFWIGCVGVWVRLSRHSCLRLFMRYNLRLSLEWVRASSVEFHPLFFSLFWEN